MHSAKDLLPRDSIAFQKMLNSLGEAFETFGFVPHSTPVISDVSLMQEQTGIQEIYQIVDPTGKLQGKGLKVDHTVPLVQFVVKHRDKLIFPFKRYTTQKVFRPKGESGFTEFYSCDVDAVAAENLSLVYDAEIIALIKHSLSAIGLNVDKTGFKIHLNNKKIVDGFMEQFNLTSCDDFAKAFKKLLPKAKGNKETLSLLEEIAENDKLKSGIEELKTIYNYAIQLGIEENMMLINPCMVRGMHYYTGTMYQTIMVSYPGLGSICHGGRYNVATEKGLNDFYGVGVTIHLTQLFSCLIKHGLMVNDKSSVADVLVSGIGSIEHAMHISSRLRDEFNIKNEMFLDQSMALDKQIEYAKKRGFKLVVWTDKIGRPLEADDLIYIQKIELNDIPRPHVCWGAFDSIKVFLHCN